MTFLVIDNYDSFTYNLVHYLGELGASLSVYRNDKISVADALASAPEGVILSPGPCTPNEAGICLELINKADGCVPILGVCLGHQSIGQAYGGNVIRAEHQMHGKVSEISHHGTSVFAGINGTVKVTRYHSLTVEEHTLPAALQVTATADDGTIMGLMHRDHPVHGVQFHPESIASEYGKHMLQNFLDLAKTHNKASSAKQGHYV